MASRGFNFLLRKCLLFEPSLPPIQYQRDDGILRGGALVEAGWGDEMGRLLFTCT